MEIATPNVQVKVFLLDHLRAGHSFNSTKST